MRKFAILMLILCLLLPALVHAQDTITPSSLALDWLTAQQTENPQFFDDPDITVISALALATYEKLDESTLLWLAAQATTDPDFATPDRAGMAILALLAAEENPYEFGNGIFLDVFNTAIEDMNPDDIPNRCFVEIVKIGAILSGWGDGVDELISYQLPDGGFPSFGDSGESDLITTSLCAQMLAYVDAEEPLNKALDYMDAQQQADGGWGSFDEMATDPLTTSFVVIAYNAADRDTSEALAYLEAAQDRETGAVILVPDMTNVDADLNIFATAFFALAIDGYSFNDYQALDG